MYAGVTEQVCDLCKCCYHGNFYDDDSFCINCCWMSLCGVPVCCCFQVTVFLLGFTVVGLTFQLGKLGIAGRELYIIRMFENVVVMGVITLFALNSNIDCYYCADPTTRPPENNPRVKYWLFIAWVCIFIHIFSSFVVTTLIDKGYDLVTQKILQQAVPEQKQQYEKKLRKIRQAARRESKWTSTVEKDFANVVDLHTITNKADIL